MAAMRQVSEIGLRAAAEGCGGLRGARMGAQNTESNLLGSLDEGGGRFGVARVSGDAAPPLSTSPQL